MDIAISDDRQCRSRGYQWPGDAYTDCRRFLLEARQREQWQELQMTRQQPQTIGTPRESAVEPWLPIREENFVCSEAVTATDVPYIDCREVN